MSSMTIQAMRNTAAWVAEIGCIAVCSDLSWRIEPGIDITDKTDAGWKRAFELFQTFDQIKGIEDLKATAGACRTLPGPNPRPMLASPTTASVWMDCRTSFQRSSSRFWSTSWTRTNFPPEGRAEVVTATIGNSTVKTYVYRSANHAFARGGGIQWNGRSAVIANGRSTERWWLPCPEG